MFKSNLNLSINIINQKYELLKSGILFIFMIKINMPSADPWCGQQVERRNTTTTLLCRTHHSVMAAQGRAYTSLVSVSERVFPGISVGLANNYNTMDYAAVKLGNQVVSSLPLQLGRGPTENVNTDSD